MKIMKKGKTVFGIKARENKTQRLQNSLSFPFAAKRSLPCGGFGRQANCCGPAGSYSDSDREASTALNLRTTNKQISSSSTRSKTHFSFPFAAKRSLPCGGCRQASCCGPAGSYSDSAREASTALNLRTTNKQISSSSTRSELQSSRAVSVCKATKR